MGSCVLNLPVESVFDFRFMCRVFAGPVVSALTNKYGCRAVCIAGSVLGATAFVLSTLSPDIGTLMLLYGFMGGMFFLFFLFFTTNEELLFYLLY